MTNQPLKGLRAIPLLRCSTAGQADTSIPDQRKALDAFIEAQGMRALEPVLLEGVSGSVRRNLDGMVDTVIARVEAGEAADVLVVYDRSRFGRTGAMHAGHLQYRLQMAGIRVVSATGFMPHAPYVDVMDLFQSEVAHEQAASIARATARGSQSSIEEGRRAYTTIAPYGTDRLVVSAEGKELATLRNLPDGTQLRMDPATGEVLQSYPPSAGGRVCGFRKAKSDRVRLVPGDPAHQAVVRRIYEMHDLEGLRPFRISGILNDEGVPGPSGGIWYKVVVRDILVNTVYCGVGVANRTARGIYVQRAPGSPKERVVPPQYAGRGYKRYRPPSEWVEIPEPALENFLPEHVRRLALPRQAAYWTSLAENPRPVTGKPKSPPRRPLSHILRDRATGKLMKSVTKGSGMSYYTAAGANQYGGTEGNRLKRLLPAEPVERVVLENIQRVLCDGQLVRAAAVEVRRALESRAKEQAVDRGGAKKLEKLERKLTRLLDQLGDFEDDAAADLVQERIARTRREVEALRREQSPPEELPPLPSVDDVVARLACLSDELGELAESNPQALRRVMEAFVASALVEPETRTVEVTLRMPPEAVLGLAVVGPEEGLVPTSFLRTHMREAPSLGSFSFTVPAFCRGKCRRTFVSQGCGTCRRRRPTRHRAGEPRVRGGEEALRG